MSWRQNLENVKFAIRTGDGKTYFPKWINGEKSKEFNATKYDFINADGSLIDRKKPQSSKYPLTFYFDGENNIEQSEAFEQSASDSRAWTVTHPFYGTIKGQPLLISRNDNDYNVTEITVDFWESISEDYPQRNSSIEDEINSRSTLVNNLAAQGYIENAAPESVNISTVKSSTEITGSRFNPDAENFNNYKNTIKTAIKSSDSLVSKTSSAITDIQAVINLPANFNRSVSNRFDSYESAYNELKKVLDLNKKHDKYFYEAQSAAIISGMSVSASTPTGNDYLIRSDIEEINNRLIFIYQDYVRTLDQIQVSNNDVEDAYSANVRTQQGLINLVTYTSQSLFILGFEAKQERNFIVEKDSNLIVLTHRFLGSANDENISKFKDINNIKLSEIYQIKKGRLIRYYV